MTFSIDNYIEKSKGIDFSKLDKGDFFEKKHPTIVTMIENLKDETDPDNLANIRRILGVYFDNLEKDIQANPSAVKKEETPNKKPNQQKNRKTKKEKKPGEPKASAERKRRLKKHKYREGQIIYAYEDGSVNKATIDALKHNQDGEPVYVYTTQRGQNNEINETVLKALIRQKVASVDKPLPEHTEKVDAEIGFLRRFVSLHGKTKTNEELLSLLKSLQTAIVERRVRKVSRYADQIDYMQDQLIRLVGAGGNVTVEFAPEKLTELKAITTGLATMPAVLLIKRFLKIQGKTGVKEEAKKLFEKISSGQPALNASEVLQDKLQIIKKALDDYISGNASTPKVTPSELNGLEGFGGVEGVDGLLPERKVAAVKSGKAMRSTDFERKRFYPMGLPGKWKRLLGEVSEPFRLMIYGKGGSGKSTLAIDLARYLADQMGKTVLFVANEEGFGATLQKKIRMLKAVHPELYLVDKMPGDLGKYDVVFLDSADSLRLTPDAAQKLTSRYPNLSLVTIHKVTKTGNFRGSAEWEHDCDTSVVVTNGIAKAEKSRFGGNGEIAVF